MEGQDFGQLHAEVLERGNERLGPERKTRVTTKKDDTPQPPTEFFDSATAAQIVAMPFDLIGNRRGEHWRLSDLEKKQIGDLFNRVTVKHAPEWLAMWGDEIALGSVVVVLVMSRLREDERIMEKEMLAQNAALDIPTGTEQPS